MIFKCWKLTASFDPSHRAKKIPAAEKRSLRRTLRESPCGPENEWEYGEKGKIASKVMDVTCVSSLIQPGN